MVNISVIIPAYNEAECITDTIEGIQNSGGDITPEIIVVDGGSTDNTAKLAEETGTRVLESAQKGRAVQMNYGAACATGDILYFLHADTLPPPQFDITIRKAIRKGYDAGCFRLSFDSSHFILQFYAWLTRFDIDVLRFGDQSLFITKDKFRQLRGFKENHIVMEDQEIIRRIRRSHSFTLLDESVTTSARKYHAVGVVKVQLIFVLIFTLYYLGTDQQTLNTLYERFLQSH